MFVIDAFNRPNGVIGGAWGTSPYAVGGQPITIINGAYACNPKSPSGGAPISYTGKTFGNDQWASAQIKQVAPFTSVVHITACSSSAGTSTYTYTLTSGSALIVNQQIIITGMQNSGNNVNIQVAGLGAGTFTAAVASPGTNESGSNGTGNSPSDSFAGMGVRCSADGKSGYFIIIGTNSAIFSNNGVGPPTDNRVYEREIWKLVNGTLTFISGDGVISSIPDVAGDIYTMTVIGSTLMTYKNGVVVTNLSNITDTDLTSGSPGICGGGLSGAGEWANPTTYTLGNGSNGTQWTNFMAGDFTFGDGNGSTLLGSDDFNRADENPLSDGGKWANPGYATAMQLVSHLAEPTVGGYAVSGSFFTGTVLPKNQYLQAKIQTLQTDGSSAFMSIRGTTTGSVYYLEITTGDLTFARAYVTFVVLVNMAFNPGAGQVLTFVAFSFTGTFPGTRLMLFRDATFVTDFYDSDTNVISGSAGLVATASGVGAAQFSGPFNAGSFQGIQNDAGIIVAVPTSLQSGQRSAVDISASTIGYYDSLVFALGTNSRHRSKRVAFEVQGASAVPTTVTVDLEVSFDAGTTWIKYSSGTTGMALATAGVSTSVVASNVVSGPLYRMNITALTLGSAGSITIYATPN